MRQRPLRTQASEEAWTREPGHRPAYCEIVRPITATPGSDEKTDGVAPKPAGGTQWTMMHGISDPMLPVSHAAVYRDLADAAGSGDKLVQVFARAGHASFSAEQFLATLEAIEHWLDTGVGPDASFFPESIGFDTDFVPPPWPY